jgi:hypothetical protein
MKLIPWAKFRAFSVRDPDTESLADADRALTEFTEYFGERDTANQRRRQRKKHAGAVRARRC